MIHVEEMRFHYPKGSAVFSDLNLDLSEGHVYGLLGKNGAGKSTLLKLLCGLIFPDQGKLEVMGYVPKWKKPSMLSDLFLIPEAFELPDMPIEKYARLLTLFYPSFDWEQFENMMEQFGVSPKKKLNTFSYGQGKKALLCLGLACNTRLILMDEPTNGLDIPSKATFRKLISAMIADHKCVVISTHQVRDVENLVDALVVVEEGKVLVNATVDKITDRLVFRQVRGDETCLYAEESVRGLYGVLPNLHQEDSKLDIEMFFNAVLTNQNQIENILK